MYNYKNYLKPYLFGKQSKNKNIIKLNSNENFFVPFPNFIKKIINEIKYFGNKLKFYPDANSYKFKKNLSLYYNLNIEQIFLGNGSDEVLGHIFYFFFKKSKILNITDITYSFYESYIKLYRIKYNLIFLKNNFKINYKKYIKGNIIITNPNAPTGKYLNIFKLELIILNNLNSIIIIDETYIDFGSKSIIKLINKYKNIIIIRTLSKSRSLAGIRIGIAFSNKEIIKILNSVKNSFNSYPINILSEIIGNMVFNNHTYFNKIRKNIIINKNFLIKNLKIFNFFILNSKSNFILIKNNKINSNKIIYFLNKNLIFIRKFEVPKIENYLRITIDNKLNCYKLIKLIKFYLENLNY